MPADVLCDVRQKGSSATMARAYATAAVQEARVVPLQMMGAPAKCAVSSARKQDDSHFALMGLASTG